MNGEAPSGSPGPRRLRVVVIVLAILVAGALVVGYVGWALLSPRMRTPGSFPGADNAPSVLDRITKDIGYTPPLRARPIWSRNIGGWDGNQGQEWILFVPKGSESKTALIAGVGHTGQETSGTGSAPGSYMAEVLGINSIGAATWSFVSDEWSIQPKGSAAVEIVETAEGVCIYARWWITRPMGPRP